MDYARYAHDQDRVCSDRWASSDRHRRPHLRQLGWPLGGRDARVHRLPRTPSTPRITLWRKLRRLGVAQIMDGVVALPADADPREQLEWLAEEVVQAGGEATIWLSEPTTAAQHRALAEAMTERIGTE